MNNFGQNLKEARENTQLSLYQNPGYQYPRRERKSVILDVVAANVSGNGQPSESFNGDANYSNNTGKEFTEFSVNLVEPLRIDKTSDVYLDSFTSNNAIPSYGTTTLNPPDGNGDKNMAILLTINEFQSDSNYASNLNTDTNKVDTTKMRSIIIPNAAADGAYMSSQHTRNAGYRHRVSKFHWVCKIEPTTITKLSGKITDNGTFGDITGDGIPVYSTPFYVGSGKTARFLAEFVIVSRD